MFEKTLGISTIHRVLNSVKLGLQLFQVPVTMPHEQGRDHGRQQTTGHKIDNEARLAKRGSFLLNSSTHIST